MTLAQLKKRRYYQLRAAGRCVACTRPSQGKAKCDNCRQHYKERAALAS